MTSLKLTIACDDYDYLQPLRGGKVAAEGIDLNLITVESGLRHHRMNHYGEYDSCEFSMGSYMVARAHDIDWLEAIPFFPRRMPQAAGNSSVELSSSRPVLIHIVKEATW